jgi:hypothetical protein
MSFGGSLSLRGSLSSHGSVLTCLSVQGTVPTPGVSCLDYAESYPTQDSTIGGGDIVAIDRLNPENVIKGNNSNSIFGVVSTNPAILINGSDIRTGTDISKQPEGTVPIALAGRVPVKVNLQGGPIKAGDYITASSIPGVGKKATRAGTVIGQALENYSGGGTVMVFVNAGFYNGTSLDDIASGIEGTGLAKTLISQFTNNPETVTGLSDVFAQRLAAQSEIIAPKVTTQNLDVLGSASFDEISVNKITAKEITGLDILTSQISSLLGQTASMAFKIISIANQSKEFDVRLSALETASRSFDIADPFQVKGALEVTGLTALNGGLKVNDIGSNDTAVNFLSDIIFFGRPYFNSDTAGFAIVPKGQKKVEVVFDREYLDEPVVNANISLDASVSEETFFASDVRYLITKKTTRGFTIVLNQLAPEDIKFNWIALAVRNAKTFTPPLPTPEASVSITPAAEPGPSATPELTPTPTETPVPTPVVSETPTPTPISEPTPESTPEPTPTPTPEISPIPEVTPVPTPEPTP